MSNPTDFQKLIMQLFKEIDHQVVIDPELRLIPEFAKVIRRDKSRSKLNAIKELAYVYFVYDYKSPYAIYPEDERKVRVGIDQKLGDNYEPDEVVSAAIEAYKRYNVTPAVATLVSVREGLLTSSKLIDAMRKRIDAALSNPDDSDIEPIVEHVVKLLDISQKLPKSIDSIEQLEERVKRELSNDSRVKGGGQVGMFED